ncbi:MAG: metal-dependent hydrolase [Candidatus Liptonbacteria bacterium]|nr:metal-dependent hydrolase [Candidatus Liptonbacteria bacterium]
MLPPGHLAAGFLTSYGLLKLSNVAFTPTEAGFILLAGTILGAIPDIDFIPFFSSRKSMRFTDSDTHRRYITHAPIIWLTIGLITALIAPNSFIWVLGLLIWLAPWSHFMGDSLEFGVRWLWPLSNRYFALGKYPDRDLATEKTLIRHYWGIIRAYMTQSITFPLEAVLLLSAAAVLVKEFLL